MTNEYVSVEFSPEQRIMHHLMLNAHFQKDIGLMSGKMGIVLALAEYQRGISEPIYEDFTDELMEEVLSGIHKELPIGFAGGLSGIGWGIEYLLQNGFMEGEGVELCEELDTKIMERDLVRMEDMSLETGIEGVLYYMLAHIKGALLQGGALPFDEAYRDDMFRVIQKFRNDPMNQNMLHLARLYEKFYTKHELPQIALSLNDFVPEIRLKEDELANWSLGLNGGLAGILIQKYITHPIV